MVTMSPWGIQKASLLVWGGEKRLGRKVPPQNGVIGGRAAADEGSEEAPLTSLKSWASSPKSLLGQPAMAQDEGNEEALLTNLNFWASAPDYLPRKFKCEIFLDFNLIFQYLCLCLDVFFKL